MLFILLALKQHDAQKSEVSSWDYRSSQVRFLRGDHVERSYMMDKTQTDTSAAIDQIHE